MTSGCHPLRARATALCAFFCISIGLPSTISAGPQDVSETSKKLQSIKIVDDPTIDLPYDVPEDVQRLLPLLKSEIRDLILSTLETLGSAAAPEKLRDSLIQKLDQASVMATNGDESYDSYGLVQSIRAERPEGEADLLAVVATLAIPCGNDSSMYVFKETAGHWSLVLAHESNGYMQVDGALGNFQFSLSPLGDGKSWYLAEAWENPWCTSVWRDIHYRALRPGHTAATPYIIFSGEHGSNISYKTSARALPNSFEIRFADYQELDFNLWVREDIEAYDITRTPPVRIAPLGLKPEDFLAEWVSLPWEEALRWTATKDPVELRSWHAQLKAVEGPDTLSIRFVQQCGHNDSAPNWLVGLKMSDGRGINDGNRNAYVSISTRGKENYTVTAAGTSRPAGCPGETQPVPDDLDTSEN